MTMLRLALVPVLLAAAGAHAQTPERLYVRALAANCSACHAGSEHGPGSIPSLEGTPREFIVSQMRAFKSGSHPSTLMHQMARGYTDQQVEQIAQWFASRRAVR
jgi:cytochrome c553